MAATTRLLAGLVLLLAALSSSAAAPAPMRPAADRSGEQLARVLPQVRIRKLHLVRPDLIFYPLMHETYC